MKITANTVGELVAELLKLDQAMQLGERDSGFVTCGIDFEVMELRRLKREPSSAIPAQHVKDFPAFEYDKDFTALVRW